MSPSELGVMPPPLPVGETHAALSEWPDDGGRRRGAEHPSDLCQMWRRKGGTFGWRSALIKKKKNK